MLAADVFLLMQPVVEFKVSKYMYIVNIENYGGVGLADVKYCNRSQMTSQRVKNKKVHTYGKMLSICSIQWVIPEEIRTHATEEIENGSPLPSDIRTSPSPRTAKLKRELKQL